MQESGTGKMKEHDMTWAAQTVHDEAEELLSKAGLHILCSMCLLEAHTLCTTFAAAQKDRRHQCWALTWKTAANTQLCKDLISELSCLGTLGQTQDLLAPQQRR
eukprot:TRINITY_DN425_c0_g1_i7.p3 TRINITY_DN425_c0_g1~~TRINITY_DN425_c0_g1_i7.p3  ORF type:complete len:104 (+),score=5.02 TRINITY_DN425_c0_g1_i7:581-892(+)